MGALGNVGDRQRRLTDHLSIDEHLGSCGPRNDLDRTSIGERRISHGRRSCTCRSRGRWRGIQRNGGRARSYSRSRRNGIRRRCRVGHVWVWRHRWDVRFGGARLGCLLFARRRRNLCRSRARCGGDRRRDDALGEEIACGEPGRCAQPDRNGGDEPKGNHARCLSARMRVEHVRSVPCQRRDSRRGSLRRNRCWRPGWSWRWSLRGGLFRRERKNRITRRIEFL